MIAGVLIGITFYIFNYPMLPMAFAELLNQPNLSIDDILPSMYASLSQVIVMTAVPKHTFWYNWHGHWIEEHPNARN